MAVCAPFVQDNSLGRLSVVTSTTRPINNDLYPSRMIYETDTKRTLQYDGTGWVILSEPAQSYTMTITSQFGTFTTLGAQLFSYHRQDGWLQWHNQITITTNGTASGSVRFTLPVVPAVANANIGMGREIAVVGFITMATWRPVPTAVSLVKYDGSYPGGSGNVLGQSGRYQMASRYS